MISPPPDRSAVNRSLPKVLGGIAILFLVLGIAGLIDDLVFTQRAIRSTAIVEETRSSGPDGPIRVTCSHHVNGKSIRCRLRVLFYFGYGPGAEVPILYLPEDPTDARLDQWYSRRLPVIVLFVLAAILGSGAIVVAWRRRRVSGFAEPVQQTTPRL